ncbi:hypothetical protein IGI04_019963 [Brassica rapa subsp. trilocularis]|uniref:Uncharacterized protein n=1 Tax=Brassica rapa subsp. trilocularis TaxID=1813537 RepID=A0ABQ7MHF1_BRACM|nr:hypothetical protein IGI04_019963 [Brassica rapa subsp. trilocularis]
MLSAPEPVIDHPRISQHTLSSPALDSGSTPHGHHPIQVSVQSWPIHQHSVLYHGRTDAFHQKPSSSPQNPPNQSCQDSPAIRQDPQDQAIALRYHLSTSLSRSIRVGIRTSRIRTRRTCIHRRGLNGRLA